MTKEVAPAIHVWFAPPAAADSLDPASLDVRQRVEWSQLRSERRRRDWRASRALQRAVRVTAQGVSSLSHSAGQAALATGPTGCTFGVDLEVLTPRPYADLAEIAFAPAEAAWLRTIGDTTDQGAAFYTLWTLKEACIKALRLELLDGLRRCRFIDDDGEWRGQLPVSAPWHATVYAPRTDVRLAWFWAGNAGDTAVPGIEMHEWPGSGADWPVVRSVGTIDSRVGPAC